MRQRQRHCSAKRRFWAYTRHSLGAASRCVEGVAPRADDLARPSGSTVAARQPHGAALAQRGARTRCSRAHARPNVADVAPSAVDLGPAVGRPIVLKACDKQHAEDERHNEAPARASREERTTDVLRE